MTCYCEVWGVKCEVPFTYFVPHIWLHLLNQSSMGCLYLPLKRLAASHSSSLSTLPSAGPTLRGHKNGIDKAIFLLRPISRGLCSGSYALDRVWASLYSLLAPHPPVGPRMLPAWVGHWFLEAQVLPQCSEERAAQGFTEEGIDDN